MSTHYQGSPEAVRVLDAWIKLSRARETVVRGIRGSVEKYGLTIAQFGVLEMVYHLGPQNQACIGRKLLWSAGNVVKVVDNLERDGLVRRVADSRDRRARIVELTGRGRQLLETVFEEHLAALIRVFAVLNADEQVTLGQLCRKLGLGAFSAIRQSTRVST